ncbi:MAG: PKD domain-containing protein, partial [Bacteroidota bacterium]
RVFNTIEPIGALQLAVDGKIYVSKVSGFLGVFNQPNNRGAAAQFQENAVLLDGRQATLGLPSFVQSFFKPILFDFEGTCLGEVTKFFPRDSVNIDPDLIEWDFGDPDSGPRNTSREMFPEHQFRKPGLYLVTLDITLRNGVSRSLTQKVYISGSLPVLDLGPDRRLCPNEELNFDVSIPGEATYIWNADTTLLSPIYSIGSPGKYWVEVSNDCGSVVDTIIVDYYDPGPPLPNNQILCPGDTFRVDATMEGAINYLWNDGVKGAVREFSRRGIYEVAITTDAGCEISKSIFIEELDSVLITTESSFQVCRGSAKVFETNIDAETFPDQNITYLWSTGSTDPSIIVENPDTTSRPIQEFYWVVVSLDSCASFASQNITLLENEFPDPPIQPVYFHCENDSVLVDLSVDSSDYRYRWFSLQLVGPPLRWVEYFEGVGPTQYFDQGGLYVLYSFDGPCLSKDTFAVITQGLPDPYIYGPDFCPGDTAVTLIAYSGAFSLDDSGFIWDDGSTNQERIVTEPGSYSVSVTNNCGTTETEVSVGRNTIPPPEVNLGNDTTLCSGNILRLDARQSQDPDAYFYSWNDGSFDSSIEITQSGIYSIRVGNGCVTVQDEIKVTFTDTPMAQFNDEEYICNEDTVKLVATNPNATYEWKNSSGEVISWDSVYFATETGTYSVAITNECFTAEYETLVLPFEDGVDIGENQLICQSGDDRVVLSVSVRDAIYTWQDGSNESTLIADTSGVYWVVVEREECISSDTVVIKYLSDLEV